MEKYIRATASIVFNIHEEIRFFGKTSDKLFAEQKIVLDTSSVKNIYDMIKDYDHKKLKELLIKLSAINSGYLFNIKVILDELHREF